MEKSKGFKFFDVLNYCFMTLISLVAVIPIYLVVVTSFTSEKYITMNGYTFFPKELSLVAYHWVLGSNSTIFNAYKVTVLITLAGLAGSLALVSMVAYAASRKHLKYRNVISMIAWIPTVFYGGLIPFYMVLVKLHFQNNIWGLFVPLLINPFNVFLMLNYFRGLPDAVMESAKIDGASDFKTFLRIVIPMSAPVLATVSLFTVMQIWNEWSLSLLMIDTNHRNLYPLQYLLRQILSAVSFSQGQSTQVVGANELPQESVKMATVVVTIGPIIFVYPFIQRYFIKGITLGAIKG